MCFQRYEAYPGRAEKVKNPVKIRPTPFAYDPICPVLTSLHVVNRLSHSDLLSRRPCEDIIFFGFTVI